MVSPVHPRELVWIYDLYDVQVGTLHKIWDLTSEDRLQDTETLSFVISADDPKVSWVKADVMVRHENRYYRISSIEKVRTPNNRAFLNVLADAIWMDLLNVARPGTFSVLATAKAGMNQILQGTGWTVGEVQTGDLLYFYSMEMTDASVLKLLREWSKVTQYELGFDTDTRQVSLLYQQGVDRGISFRYRHNIKEIKKTEIPPAVTRLVPYGANRIDIASSNSGNIYLEDFTYYTAQGMSLSEARARFLKTQIWIDEKFVDSATLYRAAVAKFAEMSQGQITYTVNVLDLSIILGYPLDGFYIGDSIGVRDEGLNIDLKSRVVRIKKKHQNHRENEIELGFFRLGLAETVPVSTATGVVDPGGGGNGDGGVGGGGTGIGGGGFTDVTLLTDTNGVAITVGSTITTLNTIPFETSGDASSIIGCRAHGTASGSGTITFYLYWGEDLVGVAAPIVFTTGQLINIGIPDWYISTEDGEQEFTFQAAVTSGSGTVAFAANSCRSYILASGASNGIPLVDLDSGGDLSPVALTQTFLEVMVAD